MLKDVEPWIKGKRVEPVYLGKDVLEWLDAHPECKNAGVVYSGDTGFYSGCGSVMRELEGWERMDREKFQVRIFPGISSLSCLCARLGRPWEGIYPASVHGKTCDYVGLLKEHGRIFLLLSNGDDLGKICRRLIEEGMGNAKAAVGQRLGYEDEKVLTGYAMELEGTKTADLAAVILEIV
jgi:precorrin-6y C5,15-methyltransferase (decarboxylating) CbiE subunit